jgi:uncharacterized spore protein YtfJ
MGNNVMDVITGIVGELKGMASAEAIIGDPVTVGDKTVVPIVKITVGFGAGGGEGEKEKSVGGFGAGGGGGAIIEPAAFIIMDKDGISLLPAKPGRIDSIVEAIPGVVNKLINLKNKLKKSGDGDGSADESEESTGPEDEYPK